MLRTNALIILSGLMFGLAACGGRGTDRPVCGGAEAVQPLVSAVVGAEVQMCEQVGDLETLLTQLELGRPVAISLAMAGGPATHLVDSYVLREGRMVVEGFLLVDPARRSRTLLDPAALQRVAAPELAGGLRLWTITDASIIGTAQQLSSRVTTIKDGSLASQFRPLCPSCPPPSVETGSYF